MGEARGGEGKGRKIGKNGGGVEYFACAKRAPVKEGRRETRGGEGRRLMGETPPFTTLSIPLGKSTNAKIFRVMADFNPRRQYIGVNFYHELLLIPKTVLQCHQFSIYH